MKGADIKKVQNKLNKLGFNAGSKDGIYGYSTEDQVIKFQKSKGLVADGKVGPATWDALMNTSSGGGSGSGSYDPNGSYHRVLRYQTPMMMGEDVKAVQKNLNEKISSGLSIDGSFGQGTESSVRTFQQRNNLSIDGAVGQNTWNKLMESFIDEVNMSPIAFGTALFDLKTYPDIISVITGNSPSLIMVPKGVEVPIQAVYENCYAIYYFNEVRYIKNYTLSNYLELESYNDVKEFEKDLNLMIRPNDPIKGLPIASIYPHVFTFFDMNEDEASFSDSKGKKRMVRKKINGSFFTPFNFRVNYKSFGYDNLINPISKSIFFETFYDHFGKFSACLGAIGVSIEALDVIYQHVKACERDGLKINWPFIVKKVIKEIAVNAGATVAITAIVGAIAGIIAAYFGIKIIFVSALLTFILTLILGPVFVTLGEALYDFLISVFEHCENFISGRKMIKLT